VPLWSNRVVKLPAPYIRSGANLLTSSSSSSYPVPAGRIVPSTSQVISDAKGLLSGAIDRIAAATNNEAIGPDARAAIVKSEAATIDAVLKATKALQAIKEVESTETVVSRMSDADLLNRILVEMSPSVGALGHLHVGEEAHPHIAPAAPPASPPGPGSVESKGLSEPGPIFQNIESQEATESADKRAAGGSNE
jgi:hypothetical protein